MAAASNIKPAQRAQAGAGLDPYAQLLKMLIPRAREIGIYGGTGRALWLSGGQDDPDMHALAVEALQAGLAAPLEIDGFARKGNDATFYAFRLRDMVGKPLAVVTMQVPDVGETRAFSLILSLVRPALECLAREVNMRVSLGALNRDLSSRDEDLELLLDVAREESGAGRDADELGRLTQAATEHLGCLVGALIVPERNVALVRRAPAAKIADAELVARTHRHLLTWAQVQRKTLLVNGVNGSDRLPPCKILSVPVRHASGRVIGFLALYRGVDADDYERRHARLGELLARKVSTILQTSFDSATGLATRAAFEAEVGAFLGEAKSAGEHSVIYIDIDQMHVINENYSMPVGDEVIARVADVVRRRVPRSARVARISGDRFAVFLPDMELAKAWRAAEVVREAATELAGSFGRANLRISLSAGVAQINLGSKQPLAHGLAAAEIACKAAKDRGRDRVERYESSDESIIRRHGDVQMISSLRDWLASDSFKLYAQPMQALSNSSAEPRFEILLRRLTEAGEVIPPAKFMSAAERYQMMPAIDEWVVNNTFAALAKHRELLTNRMARFSINLSAQSMSDDSLIGMIDKACVASSIPPDLICFELTETAAVSNLARTESIMQVLRDMGFQFALDDFGTGQSSLAYLKSLPVSVLKIDGSFVRDAMTNTRSADMVKAIAQLARTMGMTTVAEYVETDDLRVLVSNLGVDYGQGYAIGRPSPLSDILLDLGTLIEAGARASDTLIARLDVAAQAALEPPRLVPEPVDPEAIDVDELAAMIAATGNGDFGDEAD